MTYKGFTLTPEQAQRIITMSLDSMLAQLDGHGITITPPRRRVGRPRGSRGPFSKASREKISRRMKAMWKKRRAEGKAGRLNT